MYVVNTEHGSACDGQRWDIRSCRPSFMQVSLRSVVGSISCKIEGLSK